MLRSPEINSNLRAYLRIIHETKNHNIAIDKTFNSEENDDAEICVPGDVYLNLIRDPALRRHFGVMARNHQLPEFSGGLLDDSDEVDYPIPESEKRSLATLAKNDDLPITIQEREGSDDDEKRSVSSRYVYIFWRSFQFLNA